MEVAVVVQSEEADGGPRQVVGATINNNDSVINAKDSAIQTEIIKETRDSSTVSLEASPFGPWMLVPKNPRFKGRPNLVHSAGNRSFGNVGSRFSSLMENTDLVEENTHASQEGNEEIVPPSIKDKNLESKKHSRGRANQGSKNNNMPKPKQAIKEPILRTKSIENNKAPKVPFGPQSSQPTQDEKENSVSEKGRLQREKEKLILHNMKILEKNGINGLDLISTHVMLPNAESINFARAKRQSFNEGDSSSKPLVNNSNKDGESRMEIDGAQGEQHVPKQNPNGIQNGNHRVDHSLERPY
ncbi:hypothetical protein RIF29_04535 [Crotalaria pallida]|uniref:Uncharacterized protein n=1 Tax=Crotalaria pallida TaxID=3830 RepID=A0AAN9PA37_CROPI